MHQYVFAVGMIAIGFAASVAPVLANEASPPEAPVFVGAIHPISPEVAKEMTGVSYKPDCPVPLSDLRLLTLSHHTPTGDVATGELVVHHLVAQRVVDAFRDIFDAKFPIERMARIDAFDGTDDESMKANNTSAFNCRPVTGGRGFSKHAYGVAIDINPLINPYVKRRGERLIVEPSLGAPYVKRDASVPGLIVRGDVVHKAFTSRGFQWGGTWRRVQDYQHFEAKLPSKAPVKK